MHARWVVVSVLAAGCPAPPAHEPTDTTYAPPPAPLQPRLDVQFTDFRFEGGSIEFELWRHGQRVTQYARNRYAVPIVLRWSIPSYTNLLPLTPLEGVVLLPPADRPNGRSQNVPLVELEVVDSRWRYTRELTFRAKFGDPRARPLPYAYRLPYPKGLAFSVLQGFHGAFSHRGSNEYAIDFDCPVATPVLAARDGTVIAYNAAAQGAGTSPEFLDYKRTNFVLVLHDDGTIGEYMHLSPSGIEVRPGQRVHRGSRLGLSGNTGFSSTPHLHFQVMTAGDDGTSVQSFPFQLAVKPKRVEEPVQGRRYRSWE
jgi:murein DD-endopeptidase MepM/ murein hydrolase activator NlpD